MGATRANDFPGPANRYGQAEGDLPSMRTDPDVNGHQEFLVGGSGDPLVAIGNPGGWPVDLPHGGQLNGTTPFPARASASRCESPLVSTYGT